MSEQTNDPRAKEKEMIAKEMIPYFFYTAIPIVVTILIAYIFGPTV